MGYDNDADVFARLDEAVTKHPIIIKLSMSGEKPRVAEQDKVIQVCVTQMLQETHVPVSERDFKYHMEQIVLIRLGNLLKAGQLTFHKYNTIKQQHLHDIKEALRNFEIDSYDFSTDIFTRLDFHIGIRERPSDLDPMVVYGPEDGDQGERRDRNKVKDYFPERQRKPTEDEKIVITPANLRKNKDGLTVEGPEDEEDLGDQERKDRDKVRDEFGERRSTKPGEEDKIVIKPADLSSRGKKPGDGEDEEDLGDQERKDRDKVRDEFGERRSIKPGEEDKIVIKPADLSSRGKKAEEK